MEATSVVLDVAYVISIRAQPRNVRPQADEFIEKKEIVVFTHVVHEFGVKRCENEVVFNLGFTQATDTLTKLYAPPVIFSYL